MKATSLTERIVLFSNFLKGHGFKVFPSDILDSLRGMREVDLFKKEDFSSVLRANLVTTDMEWKLFGELFDEFWQEIEDEKEEEKTEDPHQEMECKGDSVEEVTLEITPDLRSPGEDACKKESMEGASYSPVSVLKKKDLALFQKGDIQIAQLILKDIISQFRVAVARRFKRSKKPAYMDFRRIFKKSLRAGGIPLELFYKKKKKRLKRLVILTDVSGSMDRYARFVIPFIMGLKGMGSRAHAFVFSTSLTPITPFLRSLPLDEALERIAHEVLDWSGGTRIGYSLHQFNQVHGARLLN
ncbi:MAG: VWA domain-containing protein, partial [Thermodesulfobacteriota bacterium]|nr:VWA domain-containing protein [Thermodesulfobacteriota bacterium]